jgi:hypothetical protein
MIRSVLTKKGNSAEGTRSKQLDQVKEAKTKEDSNSTG